MTNFKRDLTLDIYDYSGNKICPLYDSKADVEGQAYDVFIVTERNGWKELNFNLPAHDYREKYIIADYKIRAVDKDLSGNERVDWFIMTSPKVTHNSKAKNISVNAGHIAQLLKTKNLDLEFSDEYGNNTGTASELLATALQGTGWTVGTVEDFKENKKVNGELVTKVRSLKASANTGAFKLITMIADLFEAKPVYNGDSKTVDMHVMNPFSRPKNGSIYDAVRDYAAGNVLELTYGRTVSNMTRQLKSDNLITKLYAYGSYGEETTGYCGIDECKHTEHTFEITTALDANTQYYFEIQDDSETTIHRTFTTTEAVTVGTKLIWSCLDPASMMYIWNDTTEKVYRISDEQSGTNLLGDSPKATHSSAQVQNWFSFLMDFTYYNSINLISDTMLQQIANFQRKGVGYLTAINTAATDYATSWANLNQVIGDINFDKLDVTAVGTETIDDATYVKLTLKDGKPRIYETDYSAQQKFKWRVATSIKDNGDALNHEASVIYVLHPQANSNPVVYNEYHKYYIKKIDDNSEPSVVIENPGTLTLWADPDTPWSDSSEMTTGDAFYLFAYNGVNGLLGSQESADESLMTALESATTKVTIEHPVYFSRIAPVITGGQNILTNTDWFSNINIPTWADFNKQYAWWYKFDSQQLYFCYYSKGEDQQWRTWQLVHVENTTPVSANNGEYWYNWQKATLSHRENGQWVLLDGHDDEAVAAMFGVVYWACKRKDQIYTGQYQTYTIQTSDQDGFAANNWYLKDEYGALWLFSTPQAASKFEYDTTKGYLTYTPIEGAADSVKVKNYRRDNIGYHSDNIFGETSFEKGNIDTQTGGDIDGATNETHYRSGSANIYPNLSYTLSIGNNGSYTGTATLYWYTLKHDFLSASSINYAGASQSVTVPVNTRYVRIVTTGNQAVNMHIPDYLTAVLAENETYYYAGDCTGSGTLKGIVPLIGAFQSAADDTYLTKLTAMTTAQNAYNEFETQMKEALGELYREGRWQKSDYVDGDEDKLYDDALDNIKELAKPEATYTITFLDQYCVDTNAVNEDATRWPDFDSSTAAHLIDDEIGVNCWAYIDKINKCYDKPQSTTITINTNLTTMGQHSFGDIMTNIANVASEVKGKEGIYDRASTISGSGKLATEKLEGTIDANKLQILGCSSTWYTDPKGNMVFEAADESSAMMITGSGFSISNTKDKFGDWIWRSFGTGQGFTADEIVTGTLSAKLIEAGGITTDHINASVGESLDLTSNKSINLKVKNIVDDITVSNTAPDDPKLNQVWQDTSEDPAIYKRWDGTNWVTMRINESQINQTAHSIDLLVNELWGDSIDTAKSSSRITLNTDKIGWVVEGESRSSMEMTEDSLHAIAGNVDLSLNEGYKATVKGINDSMQDMTTQLNLTVDGLQTTIGDHDRILSSMTFNTEGLKIQMAGSIYYTLTDDTGYHIYQNNKEIASFSEGRGTMDEIRVGDVICHKTNKGGWAWNDMTNDTHNYINYGYDADYNERKTSGSAYDVRLSRHKMRITIDGELKTTNDTAMKLQLNSDTLKFGTAPSTFGDGISGLQNGHKYKLALRDIEGTCTSRGLVTPAIIGPTNVSRITGTGVKTDTITGERYCLYTHDSTSYPNGVRLMAFIPRKADDKPDGATYANVFDNWVGEFTFEDLGAVN